MKADPEDVVVFVEVATRGSFSAAARALGVRKSSVSRRIQKLERTLSTQLLQRTTRSLSLTEAGKGYFERARRALEELAGAERVLEGMLEEPRGVLKITVPIGLEQTTGRIIERYLDRYSEVSVVTHVTNHHVDLVAEGYDLALRAGMLQDSPLVARRLARTSVGLWASPRYLAARGTPEAPCELSQHRLLLFGTSLQSTWKLSGPRGVETLKVRGVMVANAFGLLIPVAINGGGIVACPQPVAAQALSGSGAESLVRVLPEFSLPSPGLYVVYPASGYLAPKVRHFIDLCLEERFVPESTSL